MIGSCFRTLAVILVLDFLLISNEKEKKKRLKKRRGGGDDDEIMVRDEMKDIC